MWHTVTTTLSVALQQSAGYIQGGGGDNETLWVAQHPANVRNLCPGWGRWVSAFWGVVKVWWVWLRHCPQVPTLTSSLSWSTVRREASVRSWARKTANCLGPGKPKCVWRLHKDFTGQLSLFTFKSYIEVLDARRDPVIWLHCHISGHFISP